MIYKPITSARIIHIHELFEQDYGIPRGHIQRGELDVLIERSRRRPFSNDEIGIIEQAAILLEGIIRLHIFVDGNKRTALESVRWFLNKNDYLLIIPLSGASFVYQLAMDPDLDSSEAICRVQDWLTAYSARKNQRLKINFLLRVHLLFPAQVVTFFARIGMKRLGQWLVRRHVLRHNQDRHAAEFVLEIYKKQFSLLDPESEKQGQQPAE